MSNLSGAMLAGRYKLLRQLGEGAMGEVYLGEDAQLARKVAIKVLRAEWSANPEVGKRLERECKLLAKLGAHPNIVTLYDRIEDQGKTALIMEYVEGKTLADILHPDASSNGFPGARGAVCPTNGGLTKVRENTSNILEIICQCLGALDFAHSKGIVHRDFKPSNVMVTCDHQGGVLVKLADFGIAKAIWGQASDSTELLLTRAGGPGPGTPRYMAPEQIDSDTFGSIGAVTDVYAVGVTMYELLTDTYLFDGSLHEVLIAHLRQAPIPPRKHNPQISAALQQIVLKAIEKRPENRFTSADEFCRSLRQAMVTQDGVTHQRLSWAWLTRICIAITASAVLISVFWSSIGRHPDAETKSPAVVVYPPPVGTSHASPETAGARLIASDPSETDMDDSPLEERRIFEVGTIPSGKANYRVGQPVQLRVVTTEDCFLYLFCTDAAGDTVLLLPNVFEPRCQADSGKEYFLPKETHGEGSIVANEPTGLAHFTIIAAANEGTVDLTVLNKLMNPILTLSKAELPRQFLEDRGVNIICEEAIKVTISE